MKTLYTTLSWGMAAFVLLLLPTTSQAATYWPSWIGRVAFDAPVAYEYRQPTSHEVSYEVPYEGFDVEYATEPEAPVHYGATTEFMLKASQPEPYSPVLYGQLMNNPRILEDEASPTYIAYLYTSPEEAYNTPSVLPYFETVVLPERIVNTGGPAVRSGSTGYWPTWIGRPSDF